MKRDELRAGLQKLLRKEGWLTPETDEEIEAFERKHGPPPPLSQEFIDRTTKEVLRRIRHEEV